jgi:hypothetical protein
VRCVRQMAMIVDGLDPARKILLLSSLMVRRLAPPEEHAPGQDRYDQIRKGYSRSGMNVRILSRGFYLEAFLEFFLEGFSDNWDCSLGPPSNAWP